MNFAPRSLEMTLWTWVIGLGTGTVFGVYIAQNYQVPNVMELVSKASDLAASYQKRPPPTSGSSPPDQQSPLNDSSTSSPRDK
ncbi:hypothetical protein GBAR_LOCUS21656 [Geodia barretti]|nr:hypothetical protein GBAR_LOCUS21656 [Geodia barretti]